MEDKTFMLAITGMVAAVAIVGFLAQGSSPSSPQTTTAGGATQAAGQVGPEAPTGQVTTHITSEQVSCDGPLREVARRELAQRGDAHCQSELSSDWTYTSFSVEDCADLEDATGEGVTKWTVSITCSQTSE